MQLEGVLAGLECLEDAVFIPAAFHSVQLQKEHTAMHEWAVTNRAIVKAVSRSLGLNPWDNMDAPESPLESIDYNEATRKLTKLAGRFTRRINDAHSLQDAIKAVLNIHEKVRKDLSEDDWRRMSSDWKCLEEHFLHLSDQTKCTLQELEVDIAIRRATAVTVSIQRPVRLEYSNMRCRLQVMPRNRFSGTNAATHRCG